MLAQLIHRPPHRTQQVQQLPLLLLHVMGLLVHLSSFAISQSGARYNNRTQHIIKKKKPTHMMNKYQNNCPNGPRMESNTGGNFEALAPERTRNFIAKLQELPMKRAVHLELAGADVARDCATATARAMRPSFTPSACVRRVQISQLWTGSRR